MSEIEIPDWVTKVAEDARVHCLNAVTAYGSAGVDERYHMAMRAAITAALGAWVVPVGYVGRKAMAAVSAPPFYGCDTYISSAEPTDIVCDRIYKLRQEKPE